jgi:cell division septation protein DedD
MNDDDNNHNDDKKKSPIRPAKSDSSPSSYDDEETRATLGGVAEAPSHIEDLPSTKNEVKNDGGDETLRARVAASEGSATSSFLEEVADQHHGKDLASRKSGAGGQIREGRSASTDEKHPATFDGGVHLAPGVAYPGADRDAFNNRAVEAAITAPSIGETISLHSGERDVFDSLEVGAALQPPSSGDAISLSSAIDSADVEGGAQVDDGQAPLPPNNGGARLSLDPANAIDAYVVQDAPTEESRLATLNRLTRDAPLAEIVNVIDAENTTSSSNRSQNSTSEAQRQKLLLRGGFILLLVLTATLVPLAGLGELSRSTRIATPLNTMVPSGVPSMAPTSGAPSMAPTSGAPSMAPTTPAPTSDAFSVMASCIFTNPEEERPRDPASPQWKALMWLAYEDGYNTTIGSQLVRRYALTTLYYATNGEAYVMYQCVEGGKDGVKPWLGSTYLFRPVLFSFPFLVGKDGSTSSIFCPIVTNVSGPETLRQTM